MSLTDQYALANDPVFKTKIRTATTTAANQIAASTTEESWNYAYANEVIKNPNGGWVDAMAFQVVANPVITIDSPDGDIQFAVNSNFEKCAKAFVGYLPPPPEETPLP